MADTAFEVELEGYLPLVKRYAAAARTRTYGDEPFKALAIEACEEILEEAHRVAGHEWRIDGFWFMLRAYNEGYHDMQKRVQRIAYQWDGVNTEH